MNSVLKLANALLLTCSVPLQSFYPFTLVPNLLLTLCSLCCGGRKLLFLLPAGALKLLQCLRLNGHLLRELCKQQVLSCKAGDVSLL